VYYLLPFSIGISILTALVAPRIKVALQAAAKPNWLRKLLLALACLMFLMTLPNFVTHARTQLNVDRVNQEMLASIQRLTPHEGHVFIGLDTENEYVVNIERLLIDEYGRDDIHYDFVSLETLGGLHHFSQGILVLPYIRNQPNIMLRIGKDEVFTIAWREIILYEMGDRLTELDQVRTGFYMANVNLPIVVCPLVGERGFCKNPDPMIDTREFRYGWEVLRIR
jgi:hypothetical protein